MNKKESKMNISFLTGHKPVECGPLNKFGNIRISGLGEEITSSFEDM